MTATGDVPDYAQLPLGCFLDMVASREPAPGGGASAAVAVALAAALSNMAARFSTEHLAETETLVGTAEELRGRAMPLARADAAAYGRVLDAYRSPRGDEEGRRRRVREALSEAADVPLSIAEIGAEVSGIAVRLAEEGNPSLRGDAVTAARTRRGGSARSDHARRDQRLRGGCRRRQAVPRARAPARRPPRRSSSKAPNRGGRERGMRTSARAPTS